MNMKNSWWRNAVGAGVIVCLMAIIAQGQVIPIDDFDDMVFEGWTTLDFSEGQPWGPGAYDVSNGDLRMFHTGSTPVPPGTPITQRVMFARWDESVDPLFSNGYLRAQMRTDSARNSTSVIMRANFDTFSAYVLFGNTTPVPPGEPGSAFALSRLDPGGAETRLWDSGIPYQPGEDWNVELGAVGSQISAKVWRVGQPEPDEPQYSEFDPFALSAGFIAISSDVITVDAPSFADATFDNIVFIVPEPASFVLVLVGLVSLWGRKRRLPKCGSPCVW